MKKEHISTTFKSGKKTFELTHLEKIFWPKEKITKGDLISYYNEVSSFILPYLKDRPQSLNRHPDGIKGIHFYQKNMHGDAPSWAKTITIKSESDKKNVEYLVCENKASLLYMVNLGCIEINPWNSRIKKIDYPDYLIIDLDPESVSFAKVIDAALVVRKVLDKAEIPSFCKTSGSRGMHIYIPLAAKYTHDQARDFAEIIANVCHQQAKGYTSITRLPDRRKGKVYFDYLQNGFGKTLAAPYCVRPRPGATVATPLEWKEVNQKLDPKKFTIETIWKRLDKKGDIFQGILGKGIDIEKALERLQKL